METLFITMMDQVRTTSRRVVGITPPQQLPIVHGQPMAPRPRDVTRGLVFLTLVCMVCMVYHLAWLTAAQFSVMIAAIVVLLLVHAIYLGIYGMEDGGVISAQDSYEFVRRVEEWSFFGNYFAPNARV